MNCNNIRKPIGLKATCVEIENTCNNAHMYRRCGLRPEHLIIPLDSGSGRTTLVEYMTDKYREAGVLNFASGLDDYIEISFDGSLQQLKQSFAKIDSAAIYANEYSNIVAMDISNIALHLGEVQMSEFLSGCSKVCDHATVIFFVHSHPSKNEEKLMEKISETVSNVKRMAVEPYTGEDILALIIKGITEHGIVIMNETDFCTALSDVISEGGITTVKGANATADTIARYADFSGFLPVVNVGSLKKMLTSWRQDLGRNEAK